jgi:hypothetical protein
MILKNKLNYLVLLYIRILDKIVQATLKQFLRLKNLVIKLRKNNSLSNKEKI